MAPMPTHKAATIDEYLAGVPADKRAALQWLRRQIKAAAPGAEECISYGIPAFRFDGRILVHFGAAAKHCAFYPGAVVEAHREELKGYDTSKGTVRFPPDRPLPSALVRKLVKAQIARRANARRAARRQPARTREAAANRSRLLKQMETRWRDLLASYANMSGADMTEPGVTGTWSVKDIIAHVTVWEEEARKHLPVILAGGRPPRYSVTHGGIDAFNAQMTQRNRDLPLAAVLRQRDDTHRRLVAFVERVPESECGGDTRFRRRLRLDTYGHYAVHTKAIWKWRNRRAGQ
jgi:uncharacterized protein YdhG (YjbR/CyaY superfamily)